ncbi:uncharacterized protein LOC118644317 [Monomorium pharaonis]|uniref:uncharacterized protein LOC118644317 n=1 Tax=Monomorium pharaonis TaxID=307658 RepID=UPI001746B94C|nr:uncharacterized protein LOC118644317 [Monomorium pharaonis]
MFLGSAKYINGITTSHNIVLELSGKPIELVNQATDLGVTLTSTLNWSEHIKVSANKINSILWRLKQFKNSLTTPLRVQMVSSMIFPIFDYCAAVFTDLTGQQRLRLRRLLNACVRIIFNLRWDDHVSSYYDLLGWLSADDRRTYLTGCFLFSIIHSGIPSYLASLFRPYIPPRSLSRSPPCLIVPSCRTTTYQQSFCSVGSSLWNSLPSTIRNSDSQGSFKRKFFDHLQRRESV